MNEQDVTDRLYAARDAQLRSARMPASWRELAAGQVDELAIARDDGARRKGGMVRPVAVAAMVAGLAAAVAVAVPTIHNAAVHNGPAATVGAGAAPGGPTTAARRSTTCNVKAPTAHTRLGTNGGSAPRASGPAWNRPTAAFYAGLSRNPTTLAGQLRQLAVAEEASRTVAGGDFHPSATDDADFNLSYLELNYLTGMMASKTFPADLEPAVAQVLAGMAQRPSAKVVTVPNARTSGGCTGTGYTAYDVKRVPLPIAIFDGAGNFLGTPANKLGN